MTNLESSRSGSIRRLSSFFSLCDATKLARHARTSYRVWRVVGDRLTAICLHRDRGATEQLDPWCFDQQLW